MPTTAPFFPLRLALRSTVSFVLNPVCLAICASAGACASGSDGESETESRTFEEQVADGAELYGEHCAHCHGASGQGTDDGPAVVGDGALPLEPPDERMVRENQFRTAADVFAFASENMPGDDPMSLSNSEMVDVLAFALFANGVSLEEPLSLDNAESVVLYPE